MRRIVIAITGAALVLVTIAQAADSKAHQILEFDTMAPVTGPFVGTANPIRGVNGGGLPWQLGSARGELSSGGKLEIEVRGLVLFAGAPVPPERQGTNPIANFRGIVSCLTTVEGVAQTINVATGPFPATAAGNSEIEDTVTLPTPCFAPIVFVGPSATTWFAVTGR